MGIRDDSCKTRTQDIRITIRKDVHHKNPIRRALPFRKIGVPSLLRDDVRNRGCLKPWGRESSPSRGYVTTLVEHVIKAAATL